MGQAERSSLHRSDPTPARENAGRLSSRLAHRLGTAAAGSMTAALLAATLRKKRSSDCRGRPGVRQPMASSTSFASRYVSQSSRFAPTWGIYIQAQEVPVKLMRTGCEQSQISLPNLI